MDTYFGIISKDLIYIILSKMRYKSLKLVAESYRIKLDINAYKQLFRIRYKFLYQQLSLVFNRVYYSYLGDTIYQILYIDSFNFWKSNFKTSTSWIDLYDYEKFSDITVNFVRSVGVRSDFEYLFYSLDTIREYKAAPDVISTIFNNPDVGAPNNRNVGNFYHFIET